MGRKIPDVVHIKIYKGHKREDLTGYTYGFWKVLEDIDEPGPRGERYCLCECICGEIKKVLRKSLMDGKSMSCGCNGGKRKQGDLTPGQKFGKLEIIKKISDIEYLCLCDCQLKFPEWLREYKTINKYSLTNKTTQSCGRCKISQIKPGYTKFERINVLDIKYGEKGSGDGAICICMCDCQMSLPKSNRKILEISAYSLLNGLTLSCGCLQRERAAESNRVNKPKYNTFDLDSEDYGIGYTTAGDKYIFDKEDYELIKEYSWSNTKGYLSAYKKESSLADVDTQMVKMSRLIYESHNGKTKLIVDHINGNSLDNRKENLRKATHLQNAHNIKISKKNTSGVTGVHFYKKLNKWCANIRVNYKSIHLGYYENFEDAVKARKEAEIKYFGEFRREK